MSKMQSIVEFEQQGWRALSAPGDTAKEFYAGLLADDAIMIFPGGLLIEGKERILQSMTAQPWTSFRIEEPQVISLSESVSVLAYRVTAQREGRDAYKALVSSTYVVLEGNWKLAVHQQTPV
jgi:hypothetical protein